MALVNKTQRPLVASKSLTFFAFFFFFLPSTSWRTKSVFLKCAMVTSWKINTIGGRGRWGHRKKEINRGQGVELRQRSEGLKGWGLLQLPLPLHKDLQMCTYSGRGLLHQTPTRLLYQSQILTSSALSLSHLTLPPPSDSHKLTPYHSVRGWL